MQTNNTIYIEFREKRVSKKSVLNFFLIYGGAPFEASFFFLVLIPVHTTKLNFRPERGYFSFIFGSDLHLV